MSDPLDDLDKKIRDAQARQEKHNKPHEPGDPGDDRAMGMAMRVGVDMVAGLLVGGGIGYLIDNSFDTGPWGMIVMVILGFGAGIMNVYRTVAGLGMSVGYKDSLKQAKDKAREKDTDSQSGEQ